MAYFEIKNLHITHKSYEGVKDVLNIEHLTIERGETYGLVGESGQGKTVLALAIQQLLHGEGEHGFALSRLPNEAVGLTALDGQVLNVQHIFHALIGLMCDVQMLDFKISHDFSPHFFRVLGSRISRIASPMRLKHSTVIKIATPGKMQYHHLSGK